MSKPFTWIGPVSTRALRDQLNAASDDAHLEIHEDENPGPGVILYVVEPGVVMAEGDGGGINDSHVCPPVCP